MEPRGRDYWFSLAPPSDHRGKHCGDPRLEPYQNPENAQFCVHWAPGVRSREHVSVSFELSTAANLLFFLSRGSVLGEIHVIRSLKYSTGPIRVDVSAHHHDDGALGHTKVCRMGSADEHGLLFWAEPRNPHGDPRRDVQFNITVALPIGLRTYKDLSTDLALFHHSFDRFNFDDLLTMAYLCHAIFSAYHCLLPILGGRALFIETSNAAVKGHFFGKNTLDVRTSNVPIESIAVMFAESIGSESRVQLNTSNGAIHAYMMTNHATLRAVVQTSDAPLTINKGGFLLGDTVSAWNSSFFLDASTTFGDATLYLGPIYEGTYDLQTSMAQAEIVANSIGNPGRHWTVNKTSVGQHAQGSVHWSHDGEETPEGVLRGAVKVTTSQSPIILFF
ncbi:hypothetical protein DFH07DRAFT_960519 [Mycena maculata]|uniref:Uncharacterized protein n=1 Tax=Mycena maculata TaxID=230809 RepID=A0AAD7IX70_9AGAR|nr:hypothetical protein DFH07DRAFT_960519 [Mycena maculata]